MCLRGQRGLHVRRLVFLRARVCRRGCTDARMEENRVRYVLQKKKKKEKGMDPLIGTKKKSDLLSSQREIHQGLPEQLTVRVLHDKLPRQLPLTGPTGPNL